MEGQHSFKVIGEAGKNKFIRQRINLSGGPNTKLTLSGWSRQVVANPNGGNYLMQVAINHTDGTVDWNNANDFSKTETEWQHVAASVKVNSTKNFSSIDVYYYYYNQTGTAYFDGTRLEMGDSVTAYEYDGNQNFITNIKDGLGNNLSFGYDVVGNRTSMTDGRGKTTSYAYDKRGLLTKVTDSRSAITSYGYDGVGNRTNVTDARNKVTSYEYNELNQVSKVINPLNQVTRFEYDRNGNRTKLTYPKGDVVSYSYNPLNRLQKVFYNGVERYGYNYDGNGNIIAITDTVSRENSTFIYDENNRITKVEIGTNNSIQYNYDDNDNITSIVNMAGATSVTTGYNYNQINQVIQLTRNGSNMMRFIYNEEGKVVSTNRQNDTTTSYLYDDSKRLKTITNFKANGGVQNQYTYNYDQNGNPSSVVTDKGTISYQYDDINQLISETQIDGTVISYEYDAVGNRTKKTTILGGTSSILDYTYNDGNELISVGGQAYNYDANGNLISKGSKTYIYDIDNRLQEVRNNQGQTITSFTYNHEGRRNSMTTSSGTIHFFYTGDKVLYETDENHNIIAEYTYDSEDNPATMTKGGATYYYHINGHGDVVSLTDENSNVVASYDYDAYGNIISQTGIMASANPYRYSSYRYDEVTGLYYLMARYYDANIGRFVTRDPFQGVVYLPISLNTYVYSFNNPVLYNDVSGNFALLLGAFAAVSIKALLTAILVATTVTVAIVGTHEVSKALEDKFRRRKPKIIFRTGSGNGTNLTPRTSDFLGLSYSTVKPLRAYTATTMEAINATGKLVAIKDGLTHVSVRPINMTKMKEWINSRTNANTNPHEYTKLLQALSVRVK
ncbi:RHS repeat domain-containing protein [Alkaliphilus hydrothermalis]|uniref:RHS repeat-associated protein n=1 Tax=Alkaliphilus hydrothermalis TaxID=1482730 RepID=A0ABS2NUH8_9FIRM|nr:RHS repeat-associated core domain-containing protein [Alkaliphilus hydrothermalis]MBM7616427.1 RHS repeat-associated protein [Alkaliphilus hydrothermalis]